VIDSRSIILTEKKPYREAPTNQTKTKLFFPSTFLKGTRFKLLKKMKAAKFHSVST
jgi:hypothetical protein